MSKDIAKLLRRIFLFSLPLLCIIALYIVVDPFKVVWTYDDYYPQDDSAVALDMDYVSVENYHNKSTMYAYDSFIMGNSRSRFWDVQDWAAYLPEGSECYHIEAAGESLYALAKKVEYVGGSCPKWRNALFVIDVELLQLDQPRNGYLNYLAPRAVGFSNVVGFHLSHLKAFLTPKFMWACLEYKMTGEVKPWMRDANLLSDVRMRYDVRHNQIYLDEFEKQIVQGTYYTDKRMGVFDRHREADRLHAPVLNPLRISMLSDIKRVMDCHQTDYRIVINPLYTQWKLHPSDKARLDSIFGSDNVYDFSGCNEVTADYHNYYEDSHYRPHVARRLLDIVYGGGKPLAPAAPDK